MCTSSLLYPTKYLTINFKKSYSKKLRFYEVTLTGLKGYGIDYGVIDMFTDKTVLCIENDLGQTVLNLLKESPSLWEDSVIRVKQL